MIGKAQKRFWKCFEALPESIQKLAREKYTLWKHDPYHSSLGFEERRNGICVVRIGSHYRKLCHQRGCAVRQRTVAFRRTASYAELMTADEVKALPLTEKLQIMKALWEDLRERFDRAELSQSHKDLLDQRRTRVERGDSQLPDWDTVKASIGRK